jgi:hypothetical protein
LTDFRPLIREAYLDILAREPDPSGFESYNRLMNQGLSEASLREGLLRSLEYAMKHPDPGLEARVGLNVHIPSRAILDDARTNLGMRWIRVDFDWFRIEPARGELRWEDTDRVVGRSHELGLNVLATLAYTPAWASSSPGSPAIGDPPASTTFWADIVRHSVARYGDRVRYWQLWNEPNLTQFWRGSMNQYRTEILETGAAAAREVGASVRIVAPGLSNSGNWRDWFREAMVAKNSVDIVNHHNYRSSGRAALLELEQDGFLQPSFRTLMRELGVANRPFWLTETGRRSDEGDQPVYYQDVVSTLREKAWIEKLFFFHYWDGPGQGNGGFGIVNEDFSPKPAYRFLQGILAPPPGVGTGAARAPGSTST